MANTSSRTLRLLALMQTQRFWSGGVLAARLDVAARTLRRDIDRLRDLGYPVEATRGVDGGYRLAAGATLPPLVVDDEEAIALAVGMQAAAQGAAGGMEEPALRVLTKVVQVMPQTLRRRVEGLLAVTVPAVWGGSAPIVVPEVLIAVAQACQNGERLEFSYTARTGERSARQVEPHRLVAMGHRWYLVAYDLHRHDWRSFRLDRLVDPRRIAQRFRPRELPATDAATFVQAGIRTMPAPYLVHVLVDAPAAQLRDRIGRWCTIHELAPTRSRIEVTTDSLDWPAMMLGMIETDFEILSPPELSDHLRAWGERFLRATTR